MNELVPDFDSSGFEVVMVIADIEPIKKQHAIGICNQHEPLARIGPYDFCRARICISVEITA